MLLVASSELLFFERQKNQSEQFLPARSTEHLTVNVGCSDVQDRTDWTANTFQELLKPIAEQIKQYRTQCRNTANRKEDWKILQRQQTSSVHQTILKKLNRHLHVKL